MAWTTLASGGRRAWHCAALALFLAGAACAPQTAKRGQVIDLNEAEKFQAGRTTRAEVQRALGSPSMTGTFDKDIWYYLGQNVERTAFFLPEATDRNLLAVKFDARGTVEQVARLNLADGKEVALVARQTPTAGNETTLFQDLFGNIGRFATPQRGPAPTGGGPPR